MKSKALKIVALIGMLYATSIIFIFFWMGLNTAGICNRPPEWLLSYIMTTMGSIALIGLLGMFVYAWATIKWVWGKTHG